MSDQAKQYASLPQTHRKWIALLTVRVDPTLGKEEVKEHIRAKIEEDGIYWDVYISGCFPDPEQDFP